MSVYSVSQYIGSDLNNGVLVTADLSADIDDTAATISLDAYPSEFSGITSGKVLIHNEWISFTGVSGNDLTGCTRGDDDTDGNASSAAAHFEGDYVLFMYDGDGSERYGPTASINAALSLITDDWTDRIDIYTGRYEESMASNYQGVSLRGIGRVIIDSSGSNCFRVHSATNTSITATIENIEFVECNFGIRIYGNITDVNLIIKNCKFKDCSYGIMFYDGMTNITTYQNIFERCTYGIWHDNEHRYGSTLLKVYNNTFAYCDYCIYSGRNLTFGYDSDVDETTSNLTDIKVYNNIFYQFSSYAVYTRGQGYSAKSNFELLDYNIYYSTVSSYMCNFVAFQSGSANIRNLSGTLTWSSGSTTVTGDASTDFVSELSAGDWIIPDDLDGRNWFRVDSITDVDELELDMACDFNRTDGCVARTTTSGFLNENYSAHAPGSPDLYLSDQTGQYDGISFADIHDATVSGSVPMGFSNFMASVFELSYEQNGYQADPQMVSPLQGIYDLSPTSPYRSAGKDGTYIGAREPGSVIEASDATGALRLAITTTPGIWEGGTPTGAIGNFTGVSDGSLTIEVDGSGSTISVEDIDLTNAVTKSDVAVIMEREIRETDATLRALRVFYDEDNDIFVVLSPGDNEASDIDITAGSAGTDITVASITNLIGGSSTSADLSEATGSNFGFHYPSGKLTYDSGVERIVLSSDVSSAVIRTAVEDLGDFYMIKTTNFFGIEDLPLSVIDLSTGERPTDLTYKIRGGKTMEELLASDWTTISRTSIANIVGRYVQIETVLRTDGGL